MVASRGCPTGSALPGFVNGAQPRVPAGAARSGEGGDFWAWRDAMLERGRRAHPGRGAERYEATYREMRAAGYTAVGEFHYVGFEEARPPPTPPRRPESRFVLLSPPTRAAGSTAFASRRSRRTSSRSRSSRKAGAGRPRPPLRARVPGRLAEEIGRYAEREGLVLHVHADEQPREIEECVAEHGIGRSSCSAQPDASARDTTIVHGTHADDGELDLIATPVPASASARSRRPTSGTASCR